MKTEQCYECNAPVLPEIRTYADTPSGVPNLFLQGVEIAECAKCGNSQVTIPRLLKVHSAIALALLNSPRLLTGPQFTFLRKHAEFSRDAFAKYLGVEVDELVKWEKQETPIGQAMDRLVRLLVVELALDLKELAPSVVNHLSEISNKPGDDLELHVDVNTLNHSYTFAKIAA